MEVVLSLRAQHTENAAGLKQRNAKALGEGPKRLAIADGARLGDTIEIIGGAQLSVQGEGDGRRDSELRDLVPHIPGDKREGGSHFGHDTLGFLDTLQTALAESFVLGTGAHVLDVPVKIGGDALAVAAHPALESDNMVIVAEATEVGLELLT